MTHIQQPNYILKKSVIYSGPAYAVAGSEQLQNSHFKVEATMNVFDGSFAKRIYTPYGGTHTNLAARCKVLPE